MGETKADIITRLQKDIFLLQGFKTIPDKSVVDIGLGPVRNAFPDHTFPLGAVHEFIYSSRESAAATCGFMAGVLSSLMQNGGVSIWIGPSPIIFPPALQSFGIAPANMIFINLKNEKEVLWAIEEALRCNGLAAVIGEVQELNFTASRRLQLVVEQSRVTGFILHRNPVKLNTTACVARWKITALPSELPGQMPGVGFPCWNVELLKVKNGKPANWQVEFKEGRFRHIYKNASISQDIQKKAG